MFVSQEISTESTTANCYAVRVTFANTMPMFPQLAITDTPIEDQDKTACAEIAGAQCIDGAVSGQTLTFNQCGINAQSPKFFSLFVDGMDVSGMEFMQINGELFQSPGPSLSLRPNECAAMLLDATELYTERGLMLQSHMDYADDCTMTISVCDLFQSPDICAYYLMDEDKEWESSKEHCIPDQSMQIVTICNIGVGECTPSLNYEPCHYRTEYTVRTEVEEPTRFGNAIAVVFCGLSVLFVVALFGLCITCIVGLCRRVAMVRRSRHQAGLVEEEATHHGEQKAMIV